MLRDIIKLKRNFVELAHKQNNRILKIQYAIRKTNKRRKTSKENNKKNKTDSPKKKEKAALPKAGSEAEILTLAAAALSTAAGAFVSLKKRK